jgi:uncharacterized protein (TIGR00369 family)
VGTFLERAERMLRGEEPQAPVCRTVGFALVETSPGRAVFELHAGPQHFNPMGTLHGGVLCDVADGAMGMAFASTLGEGESFTTLELKINFLKPFRTGVLRAEGRVVKRGSTVGMCECDIVDPATNTLIARASCTQMALKGEQAKSR